jgi:hypothetical protein
VFVYCFHDSTAPCWNQLRLALLAAVRANMPMVGSQGCQQVQIHAQEFVATPAAAGSQMVHGSTAGHAQPAAQTWIWTAYCTVRDAHRPVPPAGPLPLLRRAEGQKDTLQADSQQGGMYCCQQSNYAVKQLWLGNDM